MDKSNEEWRDIEGFEGMYQISTYGRVKSLKRKGCLTDRILAPSCNVNGYEFVGLSKSGKSKLCYIHRMVAKAFVTNPNNSPCVNHIDSCRTNNNVENIEWCTQLENIRHAMVSGNLGGKSFNIENIRKGEQIYNSKLTDAKVLKIRELYASGECKKVLARKFGVHVATIYGVVKRESWTHI